MAEATASDHLVDIARKPAASSHENEQGRTGPDACERGCCCRVCLIILKLITLPIIAVALIIYCLCALLAYLTFGNDVLSLTTLAKKLSGHLSFTAGGGNTGGFVFSQLKKQYKDLNWATAATAELRRRFLLLSLLWLVIVVSVPALKQIKVLGLPLWKWTVLALVVTVGYHAFSMLCQRIVKKLFREEEDKYEDKHDVVYYADGLRRSVNNVSFWVFILVAWEHYFRSSHHGLRRYGFSEKALDIGTWTFVSLLFGKFLLLAKNAVMLSWESHAIYRQFADNIGKAGLQLYFLGLVSGEEFDIFKPGKEGEGKGEGEATKKPAAKEINGKQGDGIEKGNEVPEKKSEKARKFMSKNWKLDRASTYRKKMMAKYFIKAAKLSSRKDDDVPEKIREQWRSLKEQGDPDYIINKRVKDFLRNYITKNEQVSEKEIYGKIDSLFEELKSTEELQDKERKNTCESKDKEVKNADEPNEESKDKELKNADEDQSSSSEVRIRYSTFEEWMTMAFKNCLSLGYMLSDAQSAADNLNNIMRAFIVIVVILCWLLLTGIASTKVLITIVSPFLAATFIFGDKLKATFEGIIFAFVTQPFIVGDLCIIDNIQLEVRRMNVLKTTFRKIDSQEEVSYPNKILAEKTIFNHKGDMDGKDCVDLTLSQPIDIISLEEQILEFFKNNQGKFKVKYVMVKEIGETIKIAIHFNHVMGIQDGTHTLCFEKKNKQKSELFKELIQLIQNNGNSSAKNMTESSGQKTCETA